MSVFITSLNKKDCFSGRSKLLLKQESYSFTTSEIHQTIFKLLLLRPILIKKQNITNISLKRFYSSKLDIAQKSEKPDIKLNPRWITGFADGESSFSISISENKKSLAGWRVKLMFQISLSEKDIDLLKKIQDFFTVGKIYRHGCKSICLRVESIEDLQIIIFHFERFSLITQKRADFELFKKAFLLIKQKEHTTKEGLEKIVAIRAVANFGLTDKLKAAFPHIVPAIRPPVHNQDFNPYWLAGFTSAEGCFFVGIIKASDRKTGAQVKLVLADLLW